MVVRLFATVLFMNHIDQSICFGEMLINLEQGEMQRHVARAGVILVLISSSVGFLVANFAPNKPIRETLHKMLSAKGLIAVVGVLLLTVGQCALWAMQRICSAQFTTAKVYSHNTPFFVALLILSSHILDEPGAQDLAYYYSVHALIAAPPIFSADLKFVSADAPVLARVQLGFIYCGALIYTVGLMLNRLLESRKSVLATVRPPLLSLEILGQGILQMFTLTGSILVWVRSNYGPDGKGLPNDTPNYFSKLSVYYATVAVLLPLLNLIAAVFDFRCTATFAALVSFQLVPLVAAPIANNLTDPFTVQNEYRAGYVMILLGAIFSTLFLHVRLPQKVIHEGFLEDMPMPSTAPKKRTTSMMVFWIWLLDASYLWSDSIQLYSDTVLPHYVYPCVGMIGVISFLAQHDNDIQRVAYLQLLVYVTNPSVWPLSPVLGQVGVSRSLLFILGVWFITGYSWETPAACFESFHQEYVSTTISNSGHHHGPGGQSMGILKLGEGEGDRTNSPHTSPRFSPRNDVSVPSPARVPKGRERNDRGKRPVSPGRMGGRNGSPTDYPAHGAERSPLLP